MCIAFIKLIVLSAVVFDATGLQQASVRLLAEAVGYELKEPAAAPAPQVAEKAPLHALSDASSLTVAQAYAAEAEQAAAKDAPAETAAQGAAAPASSSSGVPLEKEALLRKQEELNRQEQDLKALQTDIDAKLVRLQELEAKLGRMLKDAQETKDQKLKHLVDVYSNMKAKQAAAVLETLDERISVKILAGMRGRQAGEILTFVNAKKAARLSEALTRMQVPFE